MATGAENLKKTIKEMKERIAGLTLRGKEAEYGKRRAAEEMEGYKREREYVGREVDDRRQAGDTEQRVDAGR